MKQKIMDAFGAKARVRGRERGSGGTPPIPRGDVVGYGAQAGILMGEAGRRAADTQDPDVAAAAEQERLLREQTKALDDAGAQLTSTPHIRYEDDDDDNNPHGGGGQGITA